MLCPLNSPCALTTYSVTTAARSSFWFSDVRSVESWFGNMGKFRVAVYTVFVCSDAWRSIGEPFPPQPPHSQPRLAHEFRRLWSRRLHCPLQGALPTLPGRDPAKCRCRSRTNTVGADRAPVHRAVRSTRRAHPPQRGSRPPGRRARWKIRMETVLHHLGIGRGTKVKRWHRHAKGSLSCARNSRLRVAVALSWTRMEYRFVSTPSIGFVGQQNLFLTIVTRALTLHCKVICE